MSNDETLRCENCSSEEFYSLVQYGNYLLTCKHCKQAGPATSASAILPQLKGEFKIIQVDGNMNELALIAKGEISDYLELIKQETNRGNRLWLKACL